MGEHRRKADGRRVFSTEFKREAVQRILTGERLRIHAILQWRATHVIVAPHTAFEAWGYKSCRSCRAAWRCNPNVLAE